MAWGQVSCARAKPPNADRMAARHQAVAVMLNFVNSVGAGRRRSEGEGRQGSTKRRTGIAIIRRPPYSPPSSRT